MDKTIIGLALAGTLFFFASYLVLWYVEKRKKPA